MFLTWTTNLTFLKTFWISLAEVMTNKISKIKISALQAASLTLLHEMRAEIIICIYLRLEMRHSAFDNWVLELLMVQ